MKISVKNTGPCRRLLKVEVPADQVAAERAELLAFYTKGVSLPGFRKGHAPQALVEKKFAKELAADLKDRLVPKFYHEATEKEGLKVVGVVNVGEPELAEGKPLRFEVTVDVQPEFKLPKYHGISIKAEKTDVPEEKVNETVESIRRQHASFADITGRPAQEKDMVQISYESSIDGVPLEEKVPKARGLGKGNGYWITCDDESFLPGMGRALTGASIGDKKEVPVEFPAGFIVKELAGLKARFSVEVTGIRQAKLPEFNEEFLKQLRVESEAELRKNIRGYLEEAAQAREKGRQQDEICDFLLKKTKLDVPETAVHQQARNVVMDLARQRMMHGASREQIEAQRDDLFKEAQQKAEEHIKLHYIITAIADAENISVAEQEVADEVTRMAVQQRRDAAEFRKEMEKEGRLETVRDHLRFSKTVAFLLENAKIK